MTATLRVTPTAQGCQLVLDCDHGTTTVDILSRDAGEPNDFESWFAEALAVERHEAEEGCGCARGLQALAHAGTGGRA